MVDALEIARRNARKAGFTLLWVSAAFGFLLEAAHAFKLSRYLDVPLRRELLRWAHAHGVGLALVVLAYAVCGVVDTTSARAGRALTLGAVLVPLGFALASIDLHESDPGVAIALVPLGASLVLYGLFRVVRAAHRAS